MVTVIHKDDYAVETRNLRHASSLHIRFIVRLSARSIYYSSPSRAIISKITAPSQPGLLWLPMSDNLLDCIIREMRNGVEIVLTSRNPTGWAFGSSENGTEKALLDGRGKGA